MVSRMCKIMEDMRDDSLKEISKRMTTDGALTPEKIVEYVGISLDEGKKLQAEKKA